jgi:hypothetical protein
VFELRYGLRKDSNSRTKWYELEYRFLVPGVDASGALCPPGEWTEWRPVEFEKEKEVEQK